MVYGCNFQYSTVQTPCDQVFIIGEVKLLDKSLLNKVTGIEEEDV